MSAQPADGSRWSPIPPPGLQRTMAMATLFNTIGLGLWLAGAAMFLTRRVGLSATEVGIGLTAAGLVGLLASVPAGHLTDRRDPRILRAGMQLTQAAANLAYLLVNSFWPFMLVAVLNALLSAGALSLRGAMVAAIAEPGERVRVFATMRAVASIGISAGAGLAAVALAVDTPTGYGLLAVGNALTFVVSAALLMRLPKLPAAAGGARLDGWRALRDGRFLAVVGTAAVLTLQGTVLDLIVPLWIVTHTELPRYLISVVLVVNTVLSIALAVRLSRQADHPAAAARAMRLGGFALAVAMALFATTAGLSALGAVTALLAATVVYTFGDLLHANASAGLAFELALPQAIGQYQGASNLAHGLAAAAGPALLTGLVLHGGAAGWLALGALFALAGAATPALTRRALLRRPAVVT